MSLSVWAISVIFLVLGFAGRDVWDYGKGWTRDTRAWLRGEEQLRVLDAVEDMGYRLDGDDEQERLDFYDNPPGRAPPRFVQRLYHRWHRARYQRKLQTYTDVNGMPPMWLT